MGGDLLDKAVKEFVDSLRGQLALPKVLPDIGAKVPSTDIP